MSSGKKVFIVGPGFIGWNILDILISHGYQVSALVRRDSHAEAIKASGATAVKGDLDDKTLITGQVETNDIIFHTATADHVPSVEAILTGIKARADKGHGTIFIHTSGTSVLDDNARGAFKGDKIYYDNKPDDINAVADTAPHRDVDLTILRGIEQIGDKAKIAIMTPPLIYGYNPKHDRLTIQIPELTKFAIKHGYAPYVGEGRAVESNIHVLDLARAYVVLMHHLETAPASYTRNNPYFFCETTGDNEPSWFDVATVIGKGLHDAGKISDPKPRTVPEKDYGDLFGDIVHAVLSLNSRSRAVRLRELGWSPIEKDWKSSYLEDELPQILKRNT